MERYAFFSPAWAEAARGRINAGPSEADRAGKLQTYWDWVERAGSQFAGTLALGVRGLPRDSGRPEAYLAFAFAGGACTSVREVTAEEARRCTFCLVGRYEDWRQILGGFDMGKAIMYRKLMLESGDVLAFFSSIFFFIEALARLARVPTDLPDGAAA